MSSSRLKPSVTPATALAIRLRDRPWNFLNCASSEARFATSVPSTTSKVMPSGCPWRSWPLGPLTSTALSSTLIVTPFGIVMGFLPIRDISQLSAVGIGRPLPNVAEDFAADAGLHRRASGHHAARRGEDARAQPRQHFRHVLLAEVDAAARAADPLDARNQLLAVRPVLEEQAQRLDRRGRRDHDLVQQLEALDVALVLEDAGDLGLDPRRGHVDARLLGGHRVPDPREHVCDRVSHTLLTFNLASWCVGDL